VTSSDVPDLAEDFERRKLADYLSGLSATLPAEASRLSTLTARTLDELSEVGPDRVLTHGDFQPGNVHLDAVRVVVIDFDRAAAAPAARDLGHFIGQALTMGAARHGDLRAAVPWVEAFLRGYTGAGGNERVVAAAPAYVARTFAEVLYYRLVVRPVVDRSFVPAWLEAWERVLEQAGRSRR
jgi:aminoglycoside phosphotransferase (APT) family kinase protein